MHIGTIRARKAMGSPFILGDQGSSQRLEQISLSETGVYNEAWLQALIHAHPEILPISDIEPGFGTPVSVAREIACAHGIIDNLYITPTGDLVVIETKLWRNPEARREVLAQALDYVSALTGLSYEQLQTAAKKAGCVASSLYQLVASCPDALDEAAFFDAVSRNLQKGRMLVLIVGDGIREETEALAKLVQHQMMAQFTLALVEIRTYRRAGSGDIVAVPHTLAQTVMIERGVLTWGDGVPTMAPPPAVSTAPKTITEAKFYEELAKKDPNLPSAVKAFLKKAEALGVYPDFLSSLNLKVDVANATKPLNIGYIQKNGQLWTNPVNWLCGETVATRYAQRLADLIGGQVAIKDGIYLSTNGSSAPLISSLLPAHEQAWIDAIAELIKATESKVNQDS